jgi:putative DNA primase/helicase
MASRKRPLKLIVVNHTYMHIISENALKALVASNEPPKIFVHAGALARIRMDPEPRLEYLTVPELKGVLDRCATFVRERGPGESVWYAPARPPIDVVNDLLVRGEWPGLPFIEEIIASPVYGVEGVLHSAPGYDDESRTYLSLDSRLDIPDVQDSPSAAEVDGAVRLLVDDLLGDFPFASNSDRAHVVAMILLPFVRRMISGSTPLHLVEAPTPGTGKTLMVRVAMSISQGDRLASQAETRSDEELRKRLTSVLSAGESVVFIDNLAGELQSGVLANAITSSVWSDRLLGVSRIVVFRNRLVWIMTANNPGLSQEMARRAVRIRVVSVEERPWEGRTFRHTRLDQWARKHRGELIAACLTLVNAWLSENRPPFSGSPLGGFEEWSDVVGGILETAGILGFLGNRDDFYDEIDAETAALRIFVESWHAKFGEKKVGVRELLPLALEHVGSVFDFRDSDKSSQATQLWKQLRNLRDRRIGDFQIKRAKNRQNAAQYYLERIPGEGGEGGEGGEVAGMPQETETASNLTVDTGDEPALDLTTLTNPTNNDEEGESE